MAAAPVFRKLFYLLTRRTVLIGKHRYARTPLLYNPFRNRRHAHWLDGVYEIMLRQREGAFVDVGINVGQTMLKVLGIDRERTIHRLRPAGRAVLFRRAVHHRERSVAPRGAAAGAVEPDGHRRIEREKLRPGRPVFGDGERRAGVSPRRVLLRHEIRDGGAGRRHPAAVRPRSASGHQDRRGRGRTRGRRRPPRQHRAAPAVHRVRSAPQLPHRPARGRRRRDRRLSRGAARAARAPAPLTGVPHLRDVRAGGAQQDGAGAPATNGRSEHERLRRGSRAGRGRVPRQLAAAGRL